MRSAKGCRVCGLRVRNERHSRQFLPDRNLLLSWRNSFDAIVNVADDLCNRMDPRTFLHGGFPPPPCHTSITMPIELMHTLVAVAFLGIWVMIGVLSTSLKKAQFVKGVDAPIGSAFDHSKLG